MYFEKDTIKWSKPVDIGFKDGDIEFDTKEHCWKEDFGFFVIFIDTIETEHLLCIDKAYDKNIKECVIKKYREIHDKKTLPKNAKYKAQAGIIVKQHGSPCGIVKDKQPYNDILSLLILDNWKLLHLNVHKNIGKYKGTDIEITNENCGLIRGKSCSPSIVAYKLFEFFKDKEINKGKSLNSIEVDTFKNKKLKEHEKEHINIAIDCLEEMKYIEKVNDEKYGKNGFRLVLLVSRSKKFEDFKNDKFDEKIKDMFKKKLIKRR